MILGQCSTYNIKRLLSLQKRAARIILQADFMTPSKEMFQELGWLTFTNIVEYHICVMVFKSLNGQAPDYLSSLIRKTCPCNEYPLKPHFYIEKKLGFAGVYLFFLFLLQNIDCGYSLEPPQRGGSNVYPQSMF